MQNVVDQLESAADKFAVLQQQMPSHEAMVKVASDMNLNPEMIRRTAQVLNRATMNYQRLYEEGLDQKLADAPIIDTERVIRDVYGVSDEDKPASKVASFEDTPESRLLRQIEMRNQTKTAAAPQPKVQAPAVNVEGLYHGMRAVEVAETRNDLLKERKLAVLDVARARGVASTQIEALGHRLASMSFKTAAAVINQAKFYFEETNPAARAVVLQLADTMPVEAQLKLALYSEVPETWHPELFDKKFAPECEACVRHIEKIADVTERSIVKVAAIDEALAMIQEGFDGKVVRRTGLNHAGTMKDRDIERIRTKLASVKDLSWEEFLAEREEYAKEAGIMPAALAGAAGYGKGQKPAAPTTPSKLDQYALALSNPQHEAALSSVRTRASLQELLATDPVISASDRAEVVRSFNELSQHAPRAVEHTAVLRAALRQMLTNNTSIFDLQQLRSAER